MWTMTGGSHPLSTDISVFSNSWIFISFLMGSLENISLNNCARISVVQPLMMSIARWRCVPVELWQVLQTVLPEEGPLTLISRVSTVASPPSLYAQGYLPPDQRLASLMWQCSVTSVDSVRVHVGGGQASLICRGSARIMCMCLSSVPLENTVFGEFSAPQGC